MWQKQASDYSWCEWSGRGVDKGRRKGHRGDTEALNKGQQVGQLFSVHVATQPSQGTGM